MWVYILPFLTWGMQLAQLEKPLPPPSPPPFLSPRLAKIAIDALEKDFLTAIEERRETRRIIIKNFETINELQHTRESCEGGIEFLEDIALENIQNQPMQYQLDYLTRLAVHAARERKENQDYIQANRMRIKYLLKTRHQSLSAQELLPNIQDLAGVCEIDIPVGVDVWERIEALQRQNEYAEISRAANRYYAIQNREVLMEYFDAEKIEMRQTSWGEQNLNRLGQIGSIAGGAGAVLSFLIPVTGAAAAGGGACILQ